MTYFPQGVLGILAILIFSWVISENKKKASLKYTLVGMGSQVAFAVVILKFPPVRCAFEYLGKGVMALKDATVAGTSFVFGYLGGATAPFEVVPDKAHGLFVFAFQALPMIMVVSAIAMLLFHWRILPLIVKGLSFFFTRFLGMGGALGVCSAAKIFLGQTEAPLLIRPYLKDMSRGELFTVMTLGLATTSGTILAIYATILQGAIPDALTHILTASIISIPGAITISRLMIPHEKKDTSGEMVMPYKFSSTMDAISKGTSDGLGLFLNIIAMLVVFIALVALVNKMLGFIVIDGESLTLQWILGVVMAPITWLMGVPWAEAKTAGALLGIKTILNEMYAFLELANLKADILSTQSRVIMTYALCGFANLSSIGILIGGLGILVPEKRDEIVNLGFKALLAGTLASCLSGTVVGLLWWIW